MTSGCKLLGVGCLLSKWQLSSSSPSAQHPFLHNTLEYEMFKNLFALLHRKAKCYSQKEKSMVPRNTAYVCFSINKTCCQETWAQCSWLCHETHKLGYEQQVFLQHFPGCQQNLTNQARKVQNICPQQPAKKPIKGTVSRAKIKEAGSSVGLQTPIHSHGNAFPFSKNHSNWWKEPSCSYLSYRQELQNDKCPAFFKKIQPFGTRYVDN